jgi:anti-sigma regulatory factor (Ser/Thr protein kinase)
VKRRFDAIPVAPLEVVPGTEQTEPFEAALPPDLARLRGLRRELASWLERVGVSESDRDAVILAAHEAAANGIEHACGRVVVRGVRDEDKLLLIVTNTGRWVGRLADPEKSRGGGLSLMRGLMSQLEITVGEERTTVRMRVDLKH